MTRRQRTGVMRPYLFTLERLHKWPKPWIVQPKINGERCRVDHSTEPYTLLSSSALHINSMPHIRDSLRIGHMPHIQLDGELYHHTWKLQHIHSVVSRKSDPHPDHLQINYYIFDIINTLPQLDRMRQLKALAITHPLPYLVYVPTHEVTSTIQLMSWYNYYCAEGYEGIIVRHPHKPYIAAKTTFMMKQKKSDRLHLKIVGYNEECDIHGNPKGTLGSVIVKLPSGVTCSVGTGFTADERIDLWLDRDQLLGRYVTVAYQEFTAKGSLVSPSFKGFYTEDIS